VKPRKPSEPGAAPASEGDAAPGERPSPRIRPTRADWHVRPAAHEDVEQVAAAVAKLLVELGGKAPDLQAMRETTQALLEEPEAGVVLIATAEGVVVGMLGVSWQTAIHIPGRYALIQDLWVHPAWRSNTVGATLLEALFERAREERIERIEVGLPKDSFAGLHATEAFYRRNGFIPLGPRMRLVVPRRPVLARRKQQGE